MSAALSRALGLAPVNADNCGILSLVTQGGAQLLFSPYQGNALVIGAFSRLIPAGGVLFTASSPAVSTLYYVYAYMNGATMTLRMVTTGYIVDAAGRAYMNNGSGASDNLNRLIGMVYTGTGGGLNDAPGNRTVANYLPNARKTKAAALNVANSTASTSMTPISSVIYCMNWGDEAVTASFDGPCYISGVGQLGVQTFRSGVGFSNGTYQYQTTNTANNAMSDTVTTTSVEGVYGYQLGATVGTATGYFSGLLTITTRL